MDLEKCTAMALLFDPFIMGFCALTACTDSPVNNSRYKPKPSSSSALSATWEPNEGWSEPESTEPDLDEKIEELREQESR